MNDATHSEASAATRRWVGRCRLVAMAVVFFGALGVRLLYAGPVLADLYGVQQDRYRIAHFYHEASASLAEGDDRIVFPRGLAAGDTLAIGYPPGYFVFMAAVYAVSHDSMAAVLLAQCVFDSATCVVLFLLGEALFSSLTGLVAALLMAVSPQFAYLTLVLKPDTLTVLPVLAAVLCVVRGVATGKMSSWIGAGIALGAACWLRQNALLLAPALALVALATPAWRAQLRGAAVMLGVCVVLVAPITVRNVLDYGDPVPVTIGSGFALLSGLARDDAAGKYDLPRFAANVSMDEAAERGLDANVYWDEYDRLQAAHRRAFEVKHTVLSVFGVDGIARDRERRARAIAIIRSDVPYFLRIYAMRVGRLMGYTQQNRPVPLEVGTPDRASASLAFYTAIDPTWGRLRYYRERGEIWDLVRPRLASLQRWFVSPVLLTLAVVGLVIVMIRRRETLPILLVLPVYYLGFQALMWAEFRHTLPIHASVFMLIGVVAAAAADGVRFVGSRLGRSA